MVRRQGVAGALAAALVFSMLIVANITLLSASQQRAHLASVADAEAAVAAQASLLEQAVAFRLLAGSQSAISSATIGCSSAARDVAGSVSGISAAQSFGNLTVSGRVQYAPDESAADNMSAVRPFNGSVPGYLDLSLSLSAAGGAPSAGVAFFKQETHRANLPVKVDDDASYCLGSLLEVQSALEGSHPVNCTASSVASAVSSTVYSVLSQGRGKGLSVALGFAAGDVGACSVEASIHVNESGIEGPLGSFTVELSEQRQVLLPPSAFPLQA